MEDIFDNKLMKVREDLIQELKLNMSKEKNAVLKILKEIEEILPDNSSEIRPIDVQRIWEYIGNKKIEYL